MQIWRRTKVCRILYKLKTIVIIKNNIIKTLKIWKIIFISIIFYIYYLGAVGETLQAANGENAPAEMLPSERVMQMEEDEKREQEEKKRHRDPPIVFKDLVDIQTEYEGLVSALKGKLNDEEQTCLDELRQYVLEDEGSWALGDNFLNFVGELLK